MTNARSVTWPAARLDEAVAALARAAGCLAADRDAPPLVDGDRSPDAVIERTAVAKQPRVPCDRRERRRPAHAVSHGGPGDPARDARRRRTVRVCASGPSRPDRGPRSRWHAAPRRRARTEALASDDCRDAHAGRRLPGAVDRGPAGRRAGVNARGSRPLRSRSGCAAAGRCGRRVGRCEHSRATRRSRRTRGASSSCTPRNMVSGCLRGSSFCSSRSIRRSARRISARGR